MVAQASLELTVAQSSGIPHSGVTKVKHYTHGFFEIVYFWRHDLTEKNKIQANLKLGILLPQLLSCRVCANTPGLAFLLEA